MAKYKLTSKAVTDLTSIWEYTYQSWSESQADKYYQLLVDGFHQIAEHPENGRSYDNIENGLRGVRVAKHTILYLATKNSIEIIRILHEQMDLK